MARTFGSWLSGPPPSEAGDSVRGPGDYPGQRLGLPAAGSGSLVGTGRRLLALIIDWFIAYGLSSLLVTFGAITQEQYLYTWWGRGSVIVLWILIGAISVRLFTFTPGQYVLRLKVDSVDHRINVGIGRALLRGILVALVVPPLFGDTDGRGLQDRLTGTAVVRR
jgi:RDD family